jgi:hypothetical protein
LAILFVRFLLLCQRLGDDVSVAMEEERDGVSVHLRVRERAGVVGDSVMEKLVGVSQRGQGVEHFRARDAVLDDLVRSVVRVWGRCE